MAGELIAVLLPAANAPAAATQAAVERIASRLRADVAVFDAARELVAAKGAALPRPRGDSSGWVYAAEGPAWSLQLPDGRWFVVRVSPRHRAPLAALLLVLGSIALVVAIAAYPVVRGLTRRLERLQIGVETLGAGNLAARVKVEGRDEVARVADAFNRSAARIEELVNAHRMLLAHASHELRTPLSRLRLAIELYAKTGEAKFKDQIERDIVELDALVDEILLSSRLSAHAALQTVEEVDLLAIAAEECARSEGCTLDGTPAIVQGDARLLRRLIRNLLDNARRHGAPPVADRAAAGAERFRARRHRCRAGHSRGRAGAGVLAVPPAERGQRRHRPRAVTGAADRAPARRRRRGGAAPVAAELLPGDAAGEYRD